MTGASVDRVVWASIAALFLSNENHNRMHAVADELGVTPGLVKALLDFESGQRLTMRELGSRWRCDPSFVTVCVDGLEERGLVERRVLPTDRRVKTVELTAAGAAARERVVSTICAPRAALGALTEREQRQLARLLLKLATAEQLAEDDGGGSSIRRWLSLVSSERGSEAAASKPSKAATAARR